MRSAEKAAATIVEPAQHRFEDDSVVGAYPDGTGPDMQYGKPGERPGTDRNIAAVPAPAADPVHGGTGPLTRLWRRAT